jgi:TPR repeat protein
VITEKLKLDATHVCVVNGKPDQDVEKSKIYSSEPESFIYGEAHFYLGIMFKKGQGIVKSKEKAAEHLESAVSYGSEKAQKTLKKMTGFLGKMKGFYHH